MDYFLSGKILKEIKLKVTVSWFDATTLTGSVVFDEQLFQIIQGFALSCLLSNLNLKKSIILS